MTLDDFCSGVLNRYLHEIELAGGEGSIDVANVAWDVLRTLPASLKSELDTADPEATVRSVLVGLLMQRMEPR